MQVSDNHRLDHVQTSTGLIYVIDLALDDDLKNKIEIFSTESFSKNIVLDSYDFVEPLYNICIEEFKKLDNEVKVKTLRRILLARLPKGHSHADGIHRDYDESNNWSLLVHLKGDSGDTCFYDSIIKDTACKNVTFKPYRLIVFPSLYAHRGFTTTNLDRYTINFIVELDTKLNDKILEKSSKHIFN